MQTGIGDFVFNEASPRVGRMGRKGFADPRCGRTVFGQDKKVSATASPQKLQARDVIFDGCEDLLDGRWVRACIETLI